MRGARTDAEEEELRFLGGAEGQNRTADTMIFSHVLYQLSYLGAKRWQDF